MQRRGWRTGVRKLLAQGDRGLPNALMFLARLESQFGDTEEGKEAIKLLDDYAKDAKTKDAVENARATEKARQLLLEGRTEFQLGHADKAKELFAKAQADAHAKAFESELKEAIAALTPAK